MNLRQKYKREKKRNEELKKKLHEWNVDVRIPNLVRVDPADIITLCSVMSIDPNYSTPYVEEMHDELIHQLSKEIKPFVNFDYCGDRENYGYPKIRALLRVVKPRKD